MDWFTLVLILIFFVFPLIQQVLEAKKRGPPPIEGQPEEEWVEVEEVEVRRPRARVPAADSAPDTWSEGWGAWPGQGGPATPPVEADGTDAERERIVLARRANRRAKEEAERREQASGREAIGRGVEIPVPEVRTPEKPRRSSSRSQEPVSAEITWAPAPASAPAQKPAAPWAAETRRERPPRRAPAVVAIVRRSDRDIFLHRLRDPVELRRTLILKEILSTPIGLRSPEERFPPGG